MGADVKPAPTASSSRRSLRDKTSGRAQPQGIPATFSTADYAPNKTTPDPALTRKIQTRLRRARSHSAVLLSPLASIPDLELLAWTRSLNSEWGHDFRPDYLLIAEARTPTGRSAHRCMTATATPNKIQSESSACWACRSTRASSLVSIVPIYLEDKYTAEPKPSFVR